jgi:hypothetical protein
MIPRKQPNGDLILIGQTDHSQLVGQLAAHWGNAEFAVPDPYESVVRAATFHDYGWLAYETTPEINEETGEPYLFREVATTQRHIDDYQWCVDWLAGIDTYSGLLASMHRTGLWQARYDRISHPAGRFNPKAVRPEIQQFISHNEAWQTQERAELNENGVWVNYSLLQVWDLLGLYFCCAEPCEDYFEPVPVGYGESGGGVRLTLKPASPTQVAFDPYPFDTRPLRVEIRCKRLPTQTFPDVGAFRRAYFQAESTVMQFELV